MQPNAQALLGGANPPSAAASNGQRNPFWNMPNLSSGPPPMLAGGLTGGLPANLYPQMMAFAAAQENSTAMVAVAKLARSKANTSTNSSLVVRGSVRKFSNPMNGVLLSVAEWTRKTVEENLEWLVKLSKRHAGTDKAILLAYGDGCETLVLMDDQVNKMPPDFGKIKKVGVGVTMTNMDSTLDESKLASMGVLQPTDSIWEHLRFETLTAGDKKVEKCLFIHTNVIVWSEGLDGRRRVLQVSTGSAMSYKPNNQFEQSVLYAWKGQAPNPSVPVPIALQEPNEEAAKNETLITFNPKELLLLEKAFDNRMTNRDRKTNVAKFTEDDRKASQFVIQRAHKEFVMRGPSRKRKKVEPPTDNLKKPKAQKTGMEEAKESPSKKSKPGDMKSEKISSAKAKKLSKKNDDDDEPISKMVKKSEHLPPKKTMRSSAGSSKEGRTKALSSSEARGRKSTRGKTKQSPSPRKRSKSRSKN